MSGLLIIELYVIVTAGFCAIELVGYIHELKNRYKMADYYENLKNS